MRCAKQGARSEPPSERDDPNPSLLTAAGALQYEGYQRREDQSRHCKYAWRKGQCANQKRDRRRSGHSRQLVRRVIRGWSGRHLRTRQARSGTAHTSGSMHSGHRDTGTGTDIWRASKEQGGFVVPSGWSPRGAQPRSDARRKGDIREESDLDAETCNHPIVTQSSRRMTFGLVTTLERRDRDGTAIETGVPVLVEAKEDRLKYRPWAAIRPMAGMAKDSQKRARAWLDDFATGVAKEEPAVRAACESHYRCPTARRRHTNHETQAGQQQNGSCMGGPRSICFQARPDWRSR